jgi:hypothetical protein
MALPRVHIEVYRPEGYVYSSASNYAGIDQIIDVVGLIFLPGSQSNGHIASK